MRDLSVVDRPPTCKYSMTRTVLSIGSLRALGVDGAVDGRVDWHEVALIGKASCGRMNQRMRSTTKTQRPRRVFFVNFVGCPLGAWLTRQPARKIGGLPHHMFGERYG